MNKHAPPQCPHHTNPVSYVFQPQIIIFTLKTFLYGWWQYFWPGLLINKLLTVKLNLLLGSSISSEPLAYYSLCYDFLSVPHILFPDQALLQPVYLLSFTYPPFTNLLDILRNPTISALAAYSPSSHAYINCTWSIPFLIIPVLNHSLILSTVNHLRPAQYHPTAVRLLTYSTLLLTHLPPPPLYPSHY